MKLVVDSNILVLFFRDNPIQNIISNSKSFNLQLYAPEYALEELAKNKADIIKYSGEAEKEFKIHLNKLKELITFVNRDKFKAFEKKARELAPHDKDIPFFALGLKLNAPIWSNELAFTKQSVISIFRTQELIELIEFE